MRDFFEYSLGPNNRQVVVNSLALGHVPFEETHKAASPTQVRSEFGTGDAHEVFRDDVGVVGDDDPAALPVDPVQVGDDALYIETATVGSDCFADVSRQL